MTRLKDKVMGWLSQDVRTDSSVQ